MDRPKLSELDRKRLRRVRAREMMAPSVMRNLVRRKIVRRIDAVAPHERSEWRSVVARFYLYEIVDDRFKDEEPSS